MSSVKSPKGAPAKKPKNEAGAKGSTSTSSPAGPSPASKMHELRGHSKLRRELYRQVRDKTLPPTLLFTGPSGIGKRLVALEVAEAGLCHQLETLDPMLHTRAGCGTCQSCELFLNDSHPDLILLECADLGSGENETIRDLLGRLSLKPFMGSSRFVILNDADSLSVSSANILLKSLEEPRPGTSFILVAENPGRLPITVRSRAQQWHFEPLHADDLRALIEKQRDDPLFSSLQGLSLARIVELADGSLKTLAEVAENRDLWERIPDLAAALIEGKTSALGDTVLQLGNKREHAEKLVPALIHYSQRQLRGKMDDNLRSRWAVLISELIEAQHWIDNRNFSPSGVLTLALSQFAAEHAFTSVSSGATVTGRVLGRLNI